MTNGCAAGSVVRKSLRRFPRTSLKVFTKGWPTCDSLIRLALAALIVTYVGVSPVMAHGRKHGIVKFNGPRNEQRRVWCLARHLLRGFRRKLLDFLDFLLDFLLSFLLELFGFLGRYAVALFVFDTGAAFGGEGSVQFEKGFGV
jgi:hypothetical protein